MMRPFLFGLAFLLLVPLFASRAQPADMLPDRPAITDETRPWTRWWWHGSSVDEEELTAAMEAYRDAGLGGLEITPIYGVAGQEDSFIEYLSPEWMGKLAHVLVEGERLGLGIDLANGTGWPFGGPGVRSSDAVRYVAHRKYMLNGGERLQEPIRHQQTPILRAIGQTITPAPVGAGESADHPAESAETTWERDVSDRIDISELVEPIAANPDLQSLALEQVRFEKELPLLALVAYRSDGEGDEGGESIDLTTHVDEGGLLDWTAPDGSWSLYAIFQGWHGKMVERAAPAGEGYVIDHFSEAALDRYLRRFDVAFSDFDISGIRAFFNDSYEVDDAEGEADWTPDVFDAFESRRGYDLRLHIPALFGDDMPEKNERILSDYRETISDLLLDEFTGPWRAWAKEKGAMVRNQAHGSPANILDLYAASDIPETEGTDLFRIKMAASAANVSGKALASAESATWLNEHFRSNLADIKAALHRYWLGGINHIVYHGTAYSPSNEPWPGRLFYAAVHLTPANPLWAHFRALNRYASHVQSFLQSGRSDNDVLLYYPIYDRFGEPAPDGSLLEHFDGTLEPFEGTAFMNAAEEMQEDGFAFDFVSDRLLEDVTFESGSLLAHGAEFQTIVIPESRFIPLETLAHTIALAEEGATIVIHPTLPQSVPGFGDFPPRRAEFERFIERIVFRNTADDGIQKAQVGNGRFLQGSDLHHVLAFADIRREPLVEHGLAFVRRKEADGSVYYLVNETDSTITDWIALRTPAQAVAIFDPVSGHRGIAPIRSDETGGIQVLVQIRSGESLILQTFDDVVTGTQYTYHQEAGVPQDVIGTWTIRFTDGGPTLPDELRTDALGSWPDFPDDALDAFSGSATYTISFEVPHGDADGYQLDLGSVRESAAVFLNGEELGTVIGPTYRLVIPREALRAENILEISVSNAMANRIADLDRRGVAWKKFYNINFPSWLPENRDEWGLFDASSWTPEPSGLLGPVTLTPVDFTDEPAVR